MTTSGEASTVTFGNVFDQNQYEKLGRELQYRCDSTSEQIPHSTEELVRCLSETQIQYQGWQQGRSQGWRKGAAALQESSTCLTRIVRQYSPIADALQDAGLPFATAGFQAMYFLFDLFQKKSAVDDAVYSQLLQIDNFFPRIEMLVRVHKEKEQLQSHLFELHMGIVLWTNDATTYFRSRYSRWVKAPFAGAPTEATFKKLKTVLLNISEWTNVFLHQNINILQSQEQDLLIKIDSSRTELQIVRSDIEQSKKQLDELCEDLAVQRSLLDGIKTDLESREQERQARLAEKDEDSFKQLKKSLAAELTLAQSESPAEMRSRVNKSLEYRPNPRHGATKSRAWSSQMLSKVPAFLEWQTNSRVKLLFLGTEQPAEKGFSWITSGPLDFAYETQRAVSDTDTATLAFYSCHCDQWLPQDRDCWPDVVDILTGISLDTIENSKELLRRTSIHALDPETLTQWRKAWCLGDSRQMTDFAASVCNRATQTNRYYVVIDRLDACRYFEDNCFDVLKALKDLAMSVTNTKILVTLYCGFDRQTQIVADFIKSRDCALGELDLKAKDGNRS